MSFLKSVVVLGLGFTSVLGMLAESSFAGAKTTRRIDVVKELKGRVEQGLPTLRVQSQKDTALLAEVESREAISASLDFEIQKRKVEGGFNRVLSFLSNPFIRPKKCVPVVPLAQLKNTREAIRYVKGKQENSRLNDPVVVESGLAAFSTNQELSLLESNLDQAIARRKKYEDYRSNKYVLESFQNRNWKKIKEKREKSLGEMNEVLASFLRLQLSKEDLPLVKTSFDVMKYFSKVMLNQASLLKPDLNQFRRTESQIEAIDRELQEIQNSPESANRESVIFKILKFYSAKQKRVFAKAVREINQAIKKSRITPFAERVKTTAARNQKLVIETPLGEISQQESTVPVDNGPAEKEEQDVQFGGVLEFRMDLREALERGLLIEVSPHALLKAKKKIQQ